MGFASNLLFKSLGAATVGLIFYDAHHAGKITAPMNEKRHKADRLEERYLDDMKQSSPSVVEAAVKKKIFQYSLDENITPTYNNLTGYLKGFGSMLVSHMVPLVLALGTLAFGGIRDKGAGGFATKFCGLGLIAYGGIFLLREAFGIGKAHHHE